MSYIEKRSPSLGIFLAIILISSGIFGQTTWVVPSPSAPTIQSAIGLATTGDTIQVAAGTYVENLDFLGKDIRLLGAGVGNSIIDGGGLGPCVSMTNGEGPGALLEGFTLTNGSGFVLQTLNGVMTLGGGIYYDGLVSTGTIWGPTIRFCEITACTGDIAGIAERNGARARFEDCLIHDNVGAGHFAVSNSRSNYWRCKFYNNTATGGFAGGLNHWGGPSALPPLFEDCLFENNVSLTFQTTGGTALGGAGGAGIGSNVILRNCIVRQNTGGWGGGVSCSGDNVRLENCLVVNNHARDQGGGIRYGTGQGFQVVNCTVVGNTADGAGRAFWAYGNATSGVVMPGPPVIQWANSVIWGSGGLAATDIAFLAFSDDMRVDHCNFENGWTGSGTGNISMNPMFELDEPDLYRLRPDSPCVDAGTGGAVPLPPVDFEGQPRVIAGNADIGRDECADILIHPSFAGTIGAPGAPEVLLTVNGSAGLPLQRIALGLGQPLSFDVARPSSHLGSPQFVVFGVVGHANYFTPVTLPLNLGTMSFAPCVLAPNNPYFFLLASTGQTLNCPPVFSAQPAPWSTGSIAGIPFPLDFTIQALVETNLLGGIGITNGLKIRVR